MLPDAGFYVSFIGKLFIGVTNNTGGYGSSFDYITDATLSSPAVPEPASLGLLGIGAASLLLLRRKPAGKA